MAGCSSTPLTGPATYIVGRVSPIIPPGQSSQFEPAALYNFQIRGSEGVLDEVQRYVNFPVDSPGTLNCLISFFFFNYLFILLLLHFDLFTHFGAHMHLSFLILPCLLVISCFCFVH
jgi:hypothetical protein